MSNNGKELFACPHAGCSRLFKTKFSMKRHSLVHNAEKNYECQYCGKKFALPQYLKEHTYTHTRDKPYVCGVAGCQKRFRQAGKLSLHRRTHKEYTLKQYDCRFVSTLDKEPMPIPTETEVKDNEELKEKTVSKGFEEPEPLPKAKRDTCANSRALWRQDSGKTSATVQAKDDLGDLFKNDDWPAKPITETAAAVPTRLTKEALECHDKQLQEGDALLRYLSCLDSQVYEGLRPVLPLPRGKAPAKPPTYPQPDLFELVRKYAQV